MNEGVARARRILDGSAVPFPDPSSAPALSYHAEPSSFPSQRLCYSRTMPSTTTQSSNSARSRPTRRAGRARHTRRNDVVLLDLRGVTDMTDFFLIASGTSDTHARAVGEHIMTEMKKEGSAGAPRRRPREGTLGAARLRRLRRARLPSDAAQFLSARAACGPTPSRFRWRRRAERARRRESARGRAIRGGPRSRAGRCAGACPRRARRTTSVRTKSSTTSSSGRSRRPNTS